jgi:hypothetical protein
LEDPFRLRAFLGQREPSGGNHDHPDFCEVPDNRTGRQSDQIGCERVRGEREFNERRDQELASGLLPGKYKNEIFVHALMSIGPAPFIILNSSMPSLEVEK